MVISRQVVLDKSRFDSNEVRKLTQKMPEKIKDDQSKKNPKLCFCRAVRPSIMMCRLCGVLPLESYHEKGRCAFRKSPAWLAYSCACILGLVVHLFLDTDLLAVLETSEKKPIHAILESVTNIIYSVYVTLLCIMNVARAEKFARTLNQTVTVFKGEVICQSSFRVILTLQWGIIALVVSTILVEYFAIFFLQYSESYETNFGHEIFTNQMTQGITFAFYILFSCVCTIFNGFSACFEKLTVDALNCQPLRPMEGVDVTNNQGNFAFVISYQLCNQRHRCGAFLRKLKSHELVEYLRCLHEEACVSMRQMNACFNPQLLLHMMFELTVLIVKYYAVVIYFVYDFSSPISSTIHFLNCVFVAFHTIALFIFLKNAQMMQNMVRGLVSHLLEYSTRISTPEEHLQVRLFVNKLKWARPMNASGVVDIGLGIAGPICANILTYVLVALQFEIPQ